MTVRAEKRYKSVNFFLDFTGFRIIRVVSSFVQNLMVMAIFTRCGMFPYTRPYILTLKMYTHAWRISEKKRLPGTNELPVNGKET